MSRKILYSPGFGAGWSTWISVPTKFACEYQPIITALENKEVLTEEHPAILQFVKDCKEQFDEKPYLGGLSDLIIGEISDDEQYQINEYDGAENIITKSSQEWN